MGDYFVPPLDAAARKRGDAMVRVVENLSFLNRAARIHADNRLDRCGVKLLLSINGAAFKVGARTGEATTVSMETTIRYEDIPDDDEDLVAWTKFRIQDLWALMWAHEFEELLMEGEGDTLAYCFNPHHTNPDAGPHYHDQRPDTSLVAADRAQRLRASQSLGAHALPTSGKTPPARH